MKIGELATLARTPVETIRFYEREGLLAAPARSMNNYRVYEQAHVDRLAFIRRCRSLDMALDEIRVLLAFKDEPDESCNEVNRVLDEHIDHVAARITELASLKQQLVALRAQCRVTQDVAHCGILKGLSQGDAIAAPPAPRHVGSTHGKR